MDDILELLISSTRGALPIRLPLTKRITTIGADGHSDIQLLTVPIHWAVVHRTSSTVRIRMTATQQEHTLSVGESIEVDGISLAITSATTEKHRTDAVDTLVSELASTDSPDQSLQIILRGIMDVSRADTGAVILTEDDQYTVAVAIDKAGKPLDHADELLSDTIVRDVLGSGAQVCLSNVENHGRYAHIPSVISLKLSSVLCLPMRMDGRTLGAVFIGKENSRTPLSDELAGQLRMLVAMALPFLSQLRRGQKRVDADQIIGESEAIQSLRKLIYRVGPAELSTLITGPTGCGKELVALGLHQASRRRAEPMVSINCAALPEALLGAELFGYKRGAFTNAHTDRKGLIEAADRSTLFLDEVGDMPLGMQASLLRVLESREVTRLGEHQPREVDFRLVAATNRCLETEVREGRFREDLLFRLREVTITVPALRDREDDVVLLARTFLRQTEARLGLGTHWYSAEAVLALRNHAWPGNVRELIATVRRAAVLADHKEISPDDLQLSRKLPTTTEVSSTASLIDDLHRPLAEARDAFVQHYVRAVVQRCNNNREDAAKELQIGVRTLYRYLS